MKMDNRKEIANSWLRGLNKMNTSQENTGI